MVEMNRLLIQHDEAVTRAVQFGLAVRAIEAVSRKLKEPLAIILRGRSSRGWSGKFIRQFAVAGSATAWGRH